MTENMMEKINKSRNKNYKYRVEECDCYSSHIDHDDMALINDLDIAKLIADKLQQSAKSYQDYTVFDDEGKMIYSAKYKK
ncbi:MAG: hypothetical protein WC107_03035 [Patescibacteria group bacterium]